MSLLRNQLPVFVLFAALAVSPAFAGDERRTPVVRAVEKVTPAVVNVSTKKIQNVDPIFREYFGRHVVRRPVQSVGSGLIVHRDGYVVTNAHVVQLATEILVSLEQDGRELTYPATLLEMDKLNDLALLKLRGAEPCPAVSLGRSDDLMIGEPAIAVGNPFGVGKTVTTGVISAVNRTVRLDGNRVFRDFIQTDAAINPGNSGGPLINIRGEVIGVNTAIFRGAEGLGFAIPVDRVKEILERLINAAVDSTNLGFRSVSERGSVRVRSLDVDGAAVRGGLKEGDAVVRVDGRSVGNAFDFATPLLSKRPGDEVEIDVMRRNKVIRVSLVVPLPKEVEYVARRMGILATNLPITRREKGLTGIIVRSVIPDGPASRIGIRNGDVISMINSIEVTDLDQLATLLTGGEAGLTVRVEVHREGRGMIGNLTLN